MKKIKNNILKLVVLATLLCPAAFAEGDMGSGGKTCPDGQQTCLTGDMGSGGLASYDSPTKMDRTPEGDMGSGGRSATTETYLDQVLRSIYEYFGWTF